MPDAEPPFETEAGAVVGAVKDPVRTTITPSFGVDTTGFLTICVPELKTGSGRARRAHCIVNVAKINVHPFASQVAVLTTGPASPDCVSTLTQVSRSVAVATTLPVSPDRPATYTRPGSPLCTTLSGVDLVPCPVRNTAPLPCTAHAAASPLSPESALAYESCPATARENELPVWPDSASATVPPPASVQWVHSAAARPELPEWTSALAPCLPIEMPTAAPVDPVVATAEFVSAPAPVPSETARTTPALPDIAVDPAAPCSARAMPRASPVDPDVAFTAERRFSPPAVAGALVAEHADDADAPIRAMACAGPLTPMAIAVGRPATPPQDPAGDVPSDGIAGTTACACPLSEMEIATVHHGADVSVDAQVAPPGTYAATSTEVTGADVVQTRVAHGMTSSDAAAAPLSESSWLARLRDAPASWPVSSGTPCIWIVPGIESPPDDPPVGTPALPEVAIAEAGPLPVTLIEVALPLEPVTAASEPGPATVGPEMSCSPGIATADAGQPTEIATATVHRHVTAL